MQQYLIINHLYSVFAVRHPVDCHLSSVICLLSSVLCRQYSTSVENPLQIDLFLQNKPNFRKSQMNVSFLYTKDYENISGWTLGENKPNSNPISNRKSEAK